MGAKENLGLSDAIAKKTPFANLIGEYASEAQARTEQERLTALGFSSYVLTDHDNALSPVRGRLHAQIAGRATGSRIRVDGTDQSVRRPMIEGFQTILFARSCPFRQRHKLTGTGTINITYTFHILGNRYHISHDELW